MVSQMNFYPNHKFLKSEHTHSENTNIQRLTNKLFSAEVPKLELIFSGISDENIHYSDMPNFQVVWFFVPEAPSIIPPKCKLWPDCGPFSTDHNTYKVTRSQQQFCKCFDWLKTGHNRATFRSHLCLVSQFARRITPALASEQISIDIDSIDNQ